MKVVPKATHLPLTLKLIESQHLGKLSLCNTSNTNCLFLEPPTSRFNEITWAVHAMIAKSPGGEWKPIVKFIDVGWRGDYEDDNKWVGWRALYAK